MRFVVQGSVLQSHHLDALGRLLPNVHFNQLSAKAYYSAVSIDRHAGVSAYCRQQQLDCAFVPDEQLLSQFGLAVMDMDSTLISIECIDEVADMHGLKPQVAAITERTMRGELDFASSLRQRVALLAGLEASALQRVIDERLTLNPGAEQWIAACKQFGITTMLVSGGFDFFAEHVKTRLGLEHAQANRLEIINGKLTGRLLGDIVDAEAKAEHLTVLREQLKLKPEQVIAIGDGANDLNMMAAAGASVAYQAKPVVEQQASYALNYSGLDGVIYLFSQH